jgi:hypothetical protein
VNKKAKERVNPKNPPGKGRKREREGGGGGGGGSGTNILPPHPFSLHPTCPRPLPLSEHPHIYESRDFLTKNYAGNKSRAATDPRPAQRRVYPPPTVDLDATGGGSSSSIERKKPFHTSKYHVLSTTVGVEGNAARASVRRQPRSLGRRNYRE